MDQITVGFEPQPKKTRQEVLLGEMSQVALWSALVTLTQLHSLSQTCEIHFGAGSQSGVDGEQLVVMLD